MKVNKNYIARRLKNKATKNDKKYKILILKY